MNAKEFLMRGINLERRVDTIKDQIEHYKSLVNNCTVTYSDSPKSTTSNYKLEECTQKIMDLQAELCEAMADLVDVTCEISRAIQKIENYDYQDLLVKRYVLGQSWEKIADDMNYGIRNVHRLHGEALRELKIFS
jgi:DNA-directed RNA polymerase specialized sigma24 family protein